MAKLSLSSVGIFTRDQKAARKFYTQKMGLKVRASEPRWGYLALGATRGGEDAGLELWQPDPSWGQEMYDMGLKQIGTVTGIGFTTSDLPRTVESLKRKGVPIESWTKTLVQFKDPDGNESFLAEPRRVKVRRAGLSALAWVTVVARDAKKTGAFFTDAFGMKSRRIPGEEGEPDFVMFQLSPRGTGIGPFTPTKEMYEDPSDYDADMAHLGEETSIGLTTRDDLYRLQDRLMAKGVRFKRKAEQAEYGMITAKFFDPDDNVYTLMQPLPALGRRKK